MSTPTCPESLAFACLMLEPCMEMNRTLENKEVGVLPTSENHLRKPKVYFSSLSTLLFFILKQDNMGRKEMWLVVRDLWIGRLSGSLIQIVWVVACCSRCQAYLLQTWGPVHFQLSFDLMCSLVCGQWVSSNNFPPWETGLVWEFGVIIEIKYSLLTYHSHLMISVSIVIKVIIIHLYKL